METIKGMIVQMIYLMRKRLSLVFALLIFLAVSAVACNSQTKLVYRQTSGTATLTPFLVKATYTSESLPVELAGNGVVDAQAFTATLPEQITEQATKEQASPTPSFTSTLETQKEQPSATPKPAQPTATSKPTKPPATAKPTKPPADTNTPKPPVDTNTPEPPTDTNTPKPPTATSTPKTPTATQACVPSGNNSFEQQVINLINQERAAEGLPALTANSKLTQAARRHSSYMACTDYFNHTWKDGTTLRDRIDDTGYSWSRITENIAASSSQNFLPAMVVDLWMNSPGHKANILDENVIHIGVGFRFFDNGGYDAYYTADFARP